MSKGGKREGAGRKSKNSIIKPISLPSSYFEFVKDNNYSLSKLIQQKIEELILEKKIEKRIEYLIKQENLYIKKEKEEEEDFTGNIYFYRDFIASCKEEREFLSKNLLGNPF